MFGYLEIRDTVGHQSAGPVFALIDGHPVTRPVQLLGSSETRGTTAYYGNLKAGAFYRRLRPDPALLPPPVDDSALDTLDRDRLIVAGKYASRFTGRRTGGTGKFGEIIGGVQLLKCCTPVTAVNQVIPVRDAVADRAAAHTGRHTTVHAALPLSLQVFFVPCRQIDFPVIGAPFLNRAVADRPPWMFKKPVWMSLTHYQAPI